MRKAIFQSIFVLFPLLLALNWPTSNKHLPRKANAETSQATSNNAPSGTTTLYRADLEQGAIGPNALIAVDDPIDNVFHFHVSSEIPSGSKVYLLYDLFGVKNHHAIARSINDAQSVGGSFVEIDRNGWRSQIEELNPAIIKSGDNVLRFHAPLESNYRFAVRNLRLKVDSPLAKTPEIRRIILNLPNSHFFQEGAYLKGFISGLGAEKAQIFVNGSIQFNDHSEFEAIVKSTKPASPELPIMIKVVFADGETLIRNCMYTPGPTTATFLEPAVKAPGKMFTVKPEVAQLLECGQTNLAIPPGALTKATNISVTPLRNIDLPALPSGLVNVTGQDAGFRCLPDGLKFLVPALLTLPYDSTLIPEGYDASDICTFFFDEQSRQWKSLPKDTVLQDKGLLCSKTTHFTDYINGILKTPDAPEGRSFEKDEITKLKAGAVASNIDLIVPPSHSHMGSANLQFPIRVPAGRQGMEPHFSINYSNEVSTSWLANWYLNAPSIDIDTRWGSPRYSANLESEPYNFEGQILIPLRGNTQSLPAHQAIDIPRLAERQFLQSIESKFRKIQRHGNSPLNYWWEVTETDGTRHFYGGSPETGLDSTTVLKSNTGAVAKWMLKESRDLNDNFISYSYAKIYDSGVPGSDVLGCEIYLKQVNYTGHGRLEGPYSVEFELEENNREDVQISCRLGLKQVTSRRLHSIIVSLEKKQIRRYELSYQEGAFGKSLLKEIIVRGRKDAIFYRHQFEYYNEIMQGSEFKPFSEMEKWEIGKDDVKGNFLNGIEELKRTSALYGTSSEGFNAAFNLLFGPSISCGDKIYSIGGGYYYSKQAGEGLISLIDVDGDRLPDKVFIKNGRSYYRRNLSYLLPNSFGPVQSIPTLGAFNSTKTTTHAGNVSVHAPFGHIGVDYGRSKTVTSSYFTDFNNDGLVDLVVNGLVYFNRSVGGVPSFQRGSNGTDAPIVDGAAVDANLIPYDPQEQAMLEKEFPLQDVIRVWVAPRDGEIAIKAPVKLLIADPSSDGVRVSIQHNGQVYDTACLNPTKNTSYAFNKIPGRISVKKGDKLYFRLQSIFNGANDLVEWDPIITYQSQRLPRDPNNLDQNEYQASKDFILSAKQVSAWPFKGTLKINAELSKPLTSDSLHLELIEASVDTVIIRKTLSWDKAMTLKLDTNIQVSANAELLFQVRSASNIDWAGLKFQAHIYYLNATDPLGRKVDVEDQQGNPQISIYPAAYYTMFNDVRQASVAIPVNGSQSFEIRPKQYLLPPSGGRFNPTQLSLTVKGRKGFYGSVQFQIGGSQFANGNERIQFSVPDQDTLFVEYNVPRATLADSIFSFLGGAPLVTINGANQTAGLNADISEEDKILGPLYRGTGSFSYNGNKRERMPIDESLLNLKPQLGGRPNFNGNLDTNTVDVNYGTYDLRKADFVVHYMDAKKKVWHGSDDSTWVSGKMMCSSRLGEDDVMVIKPSAPGTGLWRPNKETKATSKSVNIGIDFSKPGQKFSLNLCGSYSRGSSESMLEILDFNGDGYPDVASIRKIQYTNPLGGLEKNTIDHLFSGSKSKDQKYGPSLPGNYNRALPSLKKTESSKSAEKASMSVGVSGVLGISTEETTFTWMDVNGDGLPDAVFANGDVCLNVGYSFLPAENWGIANIRKGESIDFSVGPSVGASFANGINIKQMSFSASYSLSNSENQTLEILEDINGDGLADKIAFDSAVTGLNIWFNLGGKFAKNPVLWRGLPGISLSTSNGESLNGGVTVCLCILFAKICFNPSGAYTRGVSREHLQLADIDADGYSDFLTSSDDGELWVQKSLIGRTNLLKKVINPLKGSFTLDYVQSEANQDLFGRKWQLSSVIIEDGRAGDGHSTTKMVFGYSGGYYHRVEREFYGYQRVWVDEVDVEKKDEVLRKTIFDYNNDHYYAKGLIQRERVQDGNGFTYSEVQNVYHFKDALTQLIVSNLKGTRKAIFPALVKTTSTRFEPQSKQSLSKIEEFSHNEHGNVTEYIDHGDGTPGDLLKAHIRYHQDAQLHLYSIPVGIVVDGTQTYRKREAEIDPKGNVKWIRQWIGGNQWAKVDMQYDQYGNTSEITRPENYLRKQMYYRFEFDPLTHTYPIQVTDAYGYVSRSEYDFGFGEVTKRIDINGQEMHYTFDDNGRQHKILSPYELAEKKDYTILFEYFLDAPTPYSKTTHFDPQHPKDGIITYAFVDGLNRTVQVKKTGVVFVGKDQPDKDVFIVSGKQRYNALGQVVATFYPVTESKGQQNTEYNKDSNNIKPRLVSYDILDRELKEVLPDGAETNYTYSIESSSDGALCFKTKVKDPLGNSVEEFKDIRERIREKVTFDPSPIRVRYLYNAISDLLSITDEQDFVIKYTYDRLGRKTSIEHPSMGLTELSLDPAGNLIRKYTANLREKFGNKGYIEYQYEYERLTQINYPEHYQNNATYKYGAPNAPHNRAGRVWLQIDGSGGQEFFYGPLGERIKTLRSILVNQRMELVFAWEQSYDSWGRPQKMIQADSEIVNHHYNLAGKLEKITSSKLGWGYAPVRRIGYDEFEQKVYLRYGNDTETFYEYEPDRRRLVGIKAFQAGRDVPFLNKQYTYDQADNILSVKNQASDGLLLLGGRSTHTYAYDPLYRLIKANGTYERNGNKQAYSLAMRYDQLGNILQKTQEQTYNDTPLAGKTFDFQYTYQANRPFQPLQVGRRSYGYDKNGNCLGWQLDDKTQERHYIWNEENRLYITHEEGFYSLNTYDADGELVCRSANAIRAVYQNGALMGPVGHAEKTKVYVNPNFVFQADNKGRFTKYYYIGPLRVLSKIGVGIFSNNHASNPSLPSAGGISYSERQKQMDEVVDSLLVSLGIDSPNPDLNSRIQLLIQMGVPIPIFNREKFETPPINWPQDGQDSCIYIPSERDSSRAGLGFQGTPGIQENEQYFYHTDHLGSSIYLSDRAGVLRQFSEYHPFGETFVEESNLKEPQYYRFNGKLQDEETGLYYYGARHYDPVVSMWLSGDPMAEKFPGWSPYNYAMLNPVKFVDPDGNLPVMVGGALLGAGFDYGTQVYGNFLAGKKGLDAFKDVNVKSILISAAAGAIGSGISSFGAKTLTTKGATLLNIAADATVNVAKQYATNGKIDPIEVVANVAVGLIVKTPIEKDFQKQGLKNALFFRQAAKNTASNIATTFGEAANSAVKISRDFINEIKNSVPKGVNPENRIDRGN